MFTKHTILAVVVIAILGMALPNSAQAVQLVNDNGNATSYITASGNFASWHFADKFIPSYSQFKLQSVQFYGYTTASPGRNLQFYIHVYEDTVDEPSAGCYTGPTICDGPIATTLPHKWVSTLQTVYLTGGTPTWVNTVVPDCVLTGSFVVGLEMIGGLTNTGLLVDNQTWIPCCMQYYWRIWSVWEWMEHWDVWVHPETFGFCMIRATGLNQGTPNPAELRVTPGQVFYGHALIPWQGGPEDIHNMVTYENIGGAPLTVNSITSSNADFTFTGVARPFTLQANQSQVFDVQFKPLSVDGWRYGNLVAVHTAGANDTVQLSGQAFNGIWLENFYQDTDPLSGDWYVWQDSSHDGGPWGGFYGGYSDQDYMEGHQSFTWTNPDCTFMDWLITDTVAAKFITNPNQAGVKVRWMQYDYAGTGQSYKGHGLFWTRPDCTYLWFAEEILPTGSGWTEVGPYFLNIPPDKFQLAWYYQGNAGDNWFIDDIMVDSLPAMPPQFTYPGHEHHSDDGPATWINPNCIHLTCHVVEPNNDPLTVTVQYRDHATPGWSSVAMSPVTGCEYMNLWEALICDLQVCHTYDYYFKADDDDPGTPTAYLPANAPTEYYTVDILDNTKPQMSYDNGTAWYVRYHPTYWEERFAVRFTPTSYPYTLGGAMVMIGAAVQGFPDDDHEDVVVELYDDNGVGGKPGTMIGTPYINNGTSWNEGADACDDTTFAKWVYVKIDPCVTITDGSFYIAVRNRDGSVDTDKEAFGYDTGPAVSPYRTWIFYADLGQWGLDTLGDASDPPGSSTNLMIRSIQCGCIPSAPTNLTVIYNAGNAELRWTDLGQNQSYKIYRSTTDPFSGYGLIATLAPGVQFYADPIGANTKAFYRIQGSCDPPSFAPPVPPTETGTMAIGPVRRTPSNLPATLMLGEQLTLEEQLKSGIMPKKINKAELEKITRAAKVGRVSRSSWNLK